MLILIHKILSTLYSNYVNIVILTQFSCFSFSQVHPSNSKLLKELCEEQAFLYIVPDNVQKRKHQRKIDNELQVLKDKLSVDNGKNVVLSNRELRLLRYYCN